MVKFKINLLRDRVPPLAVRRNVYRAMMAYCAVSGVLLVLLSYWAAGRLQSDFLTRQKIARTEAEFRMRHPGSTDLVTYGHDLNRKMDDMSATLQTITAAAESRIAIAPILLALATPLPSSVNIGAIELNRQRQVLEFEVIFPVKGVDGAADATRLLEAWNADATLKSMLGAIHSIRSQRQSQRGRPVEAWRFAGSQLTGGR
jgi:hypothetical protein